MRLMKDWMLLKQLPLESELIHIPESAIGKEKTGVAVVFEVLNVGPGWYEDGIFHPSPVKKGDKVILEVPVVAKFKYRGEEFTMAAARHVAIILNR